MIPNKYTTIEKTKLYKAIVFYRSFKSLFILKNEIVSYDDIEYLTILFALGYITNGGEGYFIRLH